VAVASWIWRHASLADTGGSIDDPHPASAAATAPSAMIIRVFIVRLPAVVGEALCKRRADRKA
jgi:hypothetical protein